MSENSDDLPSIQDYASFLNEELISPLEEEGELSSDVANDVRALLSEFREPEDLRNLGEHLQRRIRSEEDQSELDRDDLGDINKDDEE